MFYVRNGLPYIIIKLLMYYKNESSYTAIINKANRVRKAKNYIATTMQKPYDTIEIEDIYKAQTQISNAKPLSKESIKDVLNYMETQVHIDEIEKKCKNTKCKRLQIVKINKAKQ